MGVDITGSDVSSIEEGLFGFSFAESLQADEFGDQLQKVVETEGAKAVVKSMNLREIIDVELAQATCEDTNKEAHRTTCKTNLSVMQVLKTNFTYLEESGEIELTLPRPNAPILNTSIEIQTVRVSLLRKASIK